MTSAPITSRRRCSSEANRGSGDPRAQWFRESCGSGVPEGFRPFHGFRRFHGSGGSASSGFTIRLSARSWRPRRTPELLGPLEQRNRRHSEPRNPGTPEPRNPRNLRSRDRRHPQHLIELPVLSEHGDLRRAASRSRAHSASRSRWCRDRKRTSPRSPCRRRTRGGDFDGNGACSRRGDGQEYGDRKP